MLLQWLSTLVLLQLLRWSCSSMDINEEMHFHLHARVQGDGEIRGVYNTISTYAIELTNTHPTQSLELINIQSDSREFYFSGTSFPLTISPFKKIEVPFVFLPHEIQTEIDLQEYVHPVTLQIHCDLIETEFIVKATSIGNILATTTIDTLPYLDLSINPDPVQVQYQTHMDPLYSENSYKTEIRGNIVHIYSKLLLRDDFFLYEHFSDNPKFTVIVFDEIDFDNIYPSIDEKHHYILSVAIDTIDEESSTGFIYLKSNEGDYIIPVNLEESITGPMVNVDNIDFGIVFSEEQSLLQPYSLELYNPASKVLQILSVVYEPLESISILNGKRFMNGEEIKIMDIKVKKRKVLSRETTTISLQLVNLKHLPNIAFDMMGKITIETNKGSIVVPYQFKILQGNYGLLYRLDDISINNVLANRKPRSLFNSEITNFEIPLYNHLGIPFFIESVKVSDNCAELITILTRFDETITVPTSSAFFLGIMVSPFADLRNSKVYICSIEIETSISRYYVPLVIQDPPIHFTSKQVSGVMAEMQRKYLLQLVGNDNDVVHLYVTNPQLNAVTIDYNKGVRLGRIPVQLNLVLKKSFNSDAYIEKALNGNNIFENLAWRDDVTEIKKGEKLDISENENYLNLIKRLFRNNNLPSFHEEPFDEWEGNRSVTIPSGGIARFDLFRSDHVTSFMIHDNFSREHHEFKLVVNTEKSKKGLEVLTEVVRFKRMNSSKVLDFGVYPKNSNELFYKLTDENYVIEGNHVHTLRIANPHELDLSLPSSFEISHPILNAHGKSISGSDLMKPSEVRDLMQLEVVKVPGGMWEIMMRWISCLMHIMGHNIMGKQNCNLMQPPTIEDIRFSITHTEYLVLEELYNTLKTLLNDMHRVERETLMPIVRKAQELYWKVPSYFWIANGTVAIHSHEFIEYMESNSTHPPFPFFQALVSHPLKYKIAPPLLKVKLEFPISHLGVTSLAYIDVVNPSDSSIVCSLVNVDDSVFVQGIDGNEPPWWGGGHYWIHNSPLLDDGALAPVINGDNGRLLMNTHNVTISSQTTATIHLVNPSLHTSTSFTHTCGARCNLRNEVPTSHANLAHISTGAVVAKWDNGYVKSFTIGASNGVFVEPKNSMIHEQKTPVFAIPATATKTQIIQGGSTARLGPIIFRPTSIGSFSGKVGISNGWNGLEVVNFDATGGEEMLSVNEIFLTQGDGSPQAFMKKEVHKLLFSEKDMHKMLQLRNSGSLPITFSVSLSNGACQDQAFVLPECRLGESYIESYHLRTERFKIDEYTLPFHDLQVSGENFVTLQPGQHTAISLLFVQDCVYDEIWTKLLITHKNMQKFRSSVHRIFVGYKTSGEDLPCLPFQKTLPDIFHQIWLQIVMLIMIIFYILKIKSGALKRVKSQSAGLSDNQKAVLRCLTCIDPSSTQLVELSREQGRYNANRAKTKFTESRSASLAKDLADALYVTTCFDLDVESTNESLQFQPMGLNWRAFPKLLQIPKDGKVAKLLKSRKQPNSLTDIHEVSNSEDDVSIASSEINGSIDKSSETSPKAEDTLEVLRRVRFADNLVTENTTNGFMKVGSKKVLPRKIESNTLVAQVVNKEAKLPKVEIESTLEKLDAPAVPVVKKNVVVTIKRNVEKNDAKGEKVKNTVAPKKRSNAKRAQKLKTRKKADKEEPIEKEMNLKHDAKYIKMCNDVVSKQIKEKHVEAQVDNKSTDNIRPPPGLSAPPGFPASSSSKKDSPASMVQHLDEDILPPSAPVLSVEWPSFSSTKDLDLTLSAPTPTSINRQISGISYTSDEVDEHLLQPSGKNMDRQISLNSRIDPTFDDDMSSMGQELPMPLSGFSASEKPLALPQFPASDFNVENFLSSVLDEDIGIGPDEEFISQDHDENDFFQNRVEESADEWHQQQHSGGMDLDQADAPSNWDSGIVLPIIDESGFSRRANDGSLPWWHNTQKSSFNYHTDEDEDAKTDND